MLVMGIVGEELLLPGEYLADDHDTQSVGHWWCNYYVRSSCDGGYYTIGQARE